MALREIHLRLQSVVATIVGATLVACGTSTTGFDGGTDAAGDETPACGGCMCEAGAASYYATTYEVCAVDDGGLDAQADADAGDGDAAACYPSCDYACAVTAASGNNATCISETSDGGTSRTAQCAQSPFYCTGRRPDGLVDVDVRSRSLGDALARAAWLEAASVFAFRRLARELRVYGAPHELVCAARDAARDEIRHARTMRELAQRHGARVPSVVVERARVRDLESIAHENAVEACVAETFGAVVGVWQSEHEPLVELRNVMRAIAPDELRHAALAWAVAAWIEPRLSPDARERVENARAGAMNDQLQNARNSIERSLALGLLAEGVWRRAA